MKKYLLCLITIFQLQFSHAQKIEWITHAITGGASAFCPVTIDLSGNIYSLFHTTAPIVVIQGDTISSLVSKADGVVIAKFDSNGTFIWGQMVNSDGGILLGEKIAVDVAGSVYASLNFAAGGSVHLKDTVFPITASGVILKLNANGNFVRAKTFISGDAPRIACLGTDLYVGVSNTILKLDSALIPIWTDAAPAGSVAFDGSGAQRADIYVQANGQLVASAIELINFSGPILFGGDTIHFHAGNFDEEALIKMDTSGSVKNTAVISQSSGVQPEIRAVGLDGQGRMFAGINNLTGRFGFGNDTLENITDSIPYSAVLKYNFNGNPQWAVGLYPSTSVQIQNLAINGLQEVIVSGSSGQMSINGVKNFPGPPSKFFLIKFDADKNFKWFIGQANADGNSSGDGIAIRNGDEYIVGGTTQNAGIAFQFGCLAYKANSTANFISFISEQHEIYPNASFTFSVDTSTYQFIDQSSNATAWHWDFGDGDTSNLQNPSHSYTGFGTYTITLTAYHNACSADSSITITITVTSFINSVYYLKFYPMPAHDRTTIDFSLRKEENISIDIFSVTGNNVKQFIMGKFGSGAHHAELNLADLAPGIYFVKLKTSEGDVVSKLVKQ